MSTVEIPVEELTKTLSMDDAKPDCGNSRRHSSVAFPSNRLTPDAAFTAASRSSVTHECTSILLLRGLKILSGRSINERTCCGEKKSRAFQFNPSPTRSGKQIFVRFRQATGPHNSRRACSREEQSARSVATSTNLYAMGCRNRTLLAAGHVLRHATAEPNGVRP